MRCLDTSGFSDKIMKPITWLNKLLKLSNIKEGEKVLLFPLRAGLGYTNDDISGALELLGAKPIEINLPSEPLQTRHGLNEEYPNVVELMKSVDMLINGPLYSVASTEAQMAGVRNLMISSPAPAQVRLFPTKEKRELVLASAKLLKEGKEVRVVDEYGTDFTLDKTGRKAHAQYGMCDLPGKWDNSAGGHTCSAPIEDSMNGKLVIPPTSSLIPLRIIAIEKITCTVKDGQITKIEGGASARYLDDWFAMYKDDRAYGISHIGWGGDTKCDWTAFWTQSSGMDTESYAGNMLICFGCNNFDTPQEYSGLGGKNFGPSHFDIGIKTVDFYLDDALIVSDNKFVHRDLKKMAPPQFI